MTPWARREVIGACTLYQGDCLEIMPALDAGSVDMIWTDPPYGHNNNLGDLNALRADHRGSVATPIINDGSEEMRRVVDGMLRDAVRVMSTDCCCCCCCCSGGGPRPTFAWLADRMDRDGLTFFHSTIWNMINPGMGWRYRRQHEMIMIAHRDGAKLLWDKDSKPIGNIISMTAPKNRRHPNEKPVELVKLFLSLHGPRSVMDPFMGSGTTGVACAKQGRSFVGIELDPCHFDVACGRIEDAYRNPDLFAEQPSRLEQLVMNMAP